MDKKIRTGIIIFVFILLGVLVYTGLNSLSVTDTTETGVDYSTQVSLFDGNCNIPSDCNTYFDNLGMPSEKMDIVCQNNICGVQG